jgi:hypothetical protein
MVKGTQARLHEMRLVLPELPVVGGNYLPAKTVGHIVYLAGVISTNSGGGSWRKVRRLFFDFVFIS